MKILGVILLLAGCVLLTFVAYNLWQDNNTSLSPLPENSGVKVIFITPTKGP